MEVVKFIARCGLMCLVLAHLITSGHWICFAIVSVYLVISEYEKGD